MIRWHLKKHLEKKGWTNANQLATGAGLSYPVAWRIMRSEKLDRIEVDTLEKLAAAFDAKPLSLLEHTPGELLERDKKRR